GSWRTDNEQFPATRNQQPTSIRRSQIIVDLRTLEGTRKIEIAHLRFRIKLVNLPAAFAVPIPCLFYAAKREMCLCADRGSIDIRDSRVELVQGPHRNVDVTGIDRGRQTVLHIVVDRERLIGRPKPHY